MSDRVSHAPALAKQGATGLAQDGAIGQRTARHAGGVGSALWRDHLRAGGDAGIAERDERHRRADAALSLQGSLPLVSKP